MEQLTYATLYTGSDAKTHFKDDAMPWHPVASSAPAPPHVTPLQDATKIGFLRSPVGRKADWHPAPSKQFVMVLTGVMEVEAGDGRKTHIHSWQRALGDRCRLYGTQDTGCR